MMLNTLIDRAAVTYMLNKIEEQAKSTGWHAMPNTYAYQEVERILSKDNDDVSIADKYLLKDMLELLSTCCGLHYYTLIKEAYSAVRG